MPNRRKSNKKPAQRQVQNFQLEFLRLRAASDLRLAFTEGFS